MNLTDTHCHIHFDGFSQDTEAILESAKAAGVTRLICVGVSLEDSRKAVKFAAQHDKVWATVGSHPHDGADFLAVKDSAAQMAELFKMPKVVAVGEIGLDYYHEHTSRQD